MNENLPEINFKEKKEKKGGLLGWLRNRLGFGARGAVGEAGVNPAAMNVGRALGAAKFGASAGLAGFLSGNAGLLATLAVVAVAGGLYVARNSSTLPQNNSAFSSGKTAENYVPAILRSQAANQGSSLDMFKETNKGAVSMEADASKAAKPAAAEQKDAAKDGAANADQGSADQGNTPGDMMEKMQGGMGSSLTSSLGGGSSKFSGMGGFGNKFNSGASGGKLGFSNVGAGFSAMPKFDQRKNKMLAMKGAYKPQITSSKGGKYTSQGSKARSQLAAMRATQKSYTGSNIDSLRSTQDKAWEGSTGEGSADAGGAGLSDGGAGVVNTPSLDNAASSSGGTDSGDVSVPDASGATDESPWSGTLSTMLMLLTAATVLALIGYACKSIPEIGEMICMILCGIAIALAAAAVVMGVMLMKSEFMLGTLYVVGGTAVIMGAIGAMGGKTPFPISPLWYMACGGVLSLIAAMMG